MFPVKYGDCRLELTKSHSTEFMCSIWPLSVHIYRGSLKATVQEIIFGAYIFVCMTFLVACNKLNFNKTICSPILISQE